MRRPALALLALTACQGPPTPDVGASAQPVAAAVAPAPGTGGIRLSALGAVTAGASIRFLATGMQPHEEVFLVRGTAEQAGTLCPPALGGRCLDVRGPQLLRRLQADAGGRLQVALRVPAGVGPGASTVFQVATPTATSNPVLRHAPFETGTMAIGFGVHGRLGAPGSHRAVVGQRFRGDRSGFDRCTMGLPIVDDGTAPTCPGCDFAFGGSAPAWAIEFTDRGSACEDTLGVDPVRYYGGYGYTGAGQLLGFDLDHFGGSPGMFIGYRYGGAPPYWTPYAYPVQLDPRTGLFDWAPYTYATVPYGAY